MAKNPAFSMQPGGCAAQRQTTGAYAEVVARLVAARLACCPDEAAAKAVVQQMMRACLYHMKNSGQAVAGAVGALVGDYIAGNTGTKTISVEQVITSYGLTVPPTEIPGRTAGDGKPPTGTDTRPRHAGNTNALRSHPGSPRRRAR